MISKVRNVQDGLMLEKSLAGIKSIFYFCVCVCVSGVYLHSSRNNGPVKTKASLYDLEMSSFKSLFCHKYAVSHLENPCPRWGSSHHPVSPPLREQPCFCCFLTLFTTGCSLMCAAERDRHLCESAQGPLLKCLT